MKIRFEKLEIEIDEKIIGPVGQMIMMVENQRNQGRIQADRSYNDWLTSLANLGVQLFNHFTKSEPPAAPAKPADPSDPYQDAVDRFQHAADEGVPPPSF